MKKPIRCLLIAPLTRGMGFTGEDAYTQSLLENPPDGVEYTFHDDLVAAGRAQRIPWVHSLYAWLGESRLGLLPYTWTQSLETEEQFDIIHIHAWAVALGRNLRRSGIPIVISASTAPVYGLRTYKHWSENRITAYAHVIRSLQRSLNIYDCYFFQGPAHQVMVWSQFARADFEASGIHRSRLVIVPPGIPDPSWCPNHRSDDCVRVLFVANDFVRKGGPMLVEVYHRLRDELPNQVTLTIIGTDVPAPYSREGINILGFLERPKVHDYFRQHDVLVLPSEAEGYGMAVIEAFSFGLPVIVSNVGAMSEIVTSDVGLRHDPGDKNALYDALRKLVTDADLRSRMGSAARQRFLESYVTQSTNSLLRDVYLDTMKSSIGLHSRR